MMIAILETISMGHLIRDDFVACSNDYETVDDARSAFQVVLTGYGLCFDNDQFNEQCPHRNCYTTLGIYTDNSGCSVRVCDAFMRWRCIERSGKWEVSGFII